MKLFLNIAVLFLLVGGLISCSESTQEGENQSEELSNDRTDNDGRTEWSVNEIINRLVENLDERLDLSDEAKTAIRQTYQDAYTTTRGNLDDRLSQDQAIEVRQEILRETKSEVLVYLNEDQANFYERFSGGDR